MPFSKSVRPSASNARGAMSKNSLSNVVSSSNQRRADYPGKTLRLFTESTLFFFVFTGSTLF
jgi:hypothetical protein